MSKQRRRPQEWTIGAVLEPMAGDLWAAPDQYSVGSWAGLSRDAPPNESLLERLHRMSGVVHTMAGDAQGDCLRELKKIRTVLRKLTNEFSDAVDFAEKKSNSDFGGTR